VAVTPALQHMRVNSTAVITHCDSEMRRRIFNLNLNTARRSMPKMHSPALRGQCDRLRPGLPDEADVASLPQSHGMQLPAPLLVPAEFAKRLLKLSRIVARRAKPLKRNSSLVYDVIHEPLDLIQKRLRRC